MDIVDAQIHLIMPHPERPREPLEPLGGPPHDRSFTIEDAVASMDATGIAASVISLVPFRSKGREVAPGVMRFDNDYAEEAARRFPGRFASVPRFDPRDPELDDQLSGLRKRPGAIGIRCVLFAEAEWKRWEAGGYERLFAAAEKYDVPMMLFVTRHVEKVDKVACAHPTLPLVIDHFGMPQPPHMPDADSWGNLPALLALARYPNVSVKFSGAPAMTYEPYPYHGLWPNLHRVVDAFGPQRLMWGSDVTRVRGLHTLSEALGYVRYTDELSQSDREWILGRTLRKILRWPEA